MKLATFGAAALFSTLAPAAQADITLDDFSTPASFSIFIGAPIYESRAVTFAGNAAVRSESLTQNSSSVVVNGSSMAVSGACLVGYWSSLNIPASGSGQVGRSDANALSPLLDLSNESMIEIDFTVPQTNFGVITLTVWDSTLTVSDSVSTGSLPTNGSYTLFIDPAVDFAGNVDLSAIGGVTLFVTGSSSTTITRFEATGGATFPSFCDDADGSLASCPCANPGDPDSGCDIQQGTGGVKLDVVQQTSGASNGVTMTGAGFPPASAPASIVIRASSLEAAPVPFGDGLRCVGTPLVRLAATFAASGSTTHTFGHGTMAGTGDFYYQLWFRNTPAMFCTPDAFNLSNGRILTW